MVIRDTFKDLAKQTSVHADAEMHPSPKGKRIIASYENLTLAPVILRAVFILTQ